MKRLILTLATIAAMTMLGSCGGSSNRADSNDSLSVSVNAGSLMSDISESTTIGVAIDGAMNSVYVLTTEGDTLQFAYGHLPAAKRTNWNIGDTVTVKYLRRADGDSVLALMRGAKP